MKREDKSPLFKGIFREKIKFIFNGRKDPTFVGNDEAVQFIRKK